MDDRSSLVGPDEQRRDAERFVSVGKSLADYLTHIGALFELRAQQRAATGSSGDLAEREAALAAELTRTDADELKLREDAAGARIPLRPALVVLGKWSLFASVLTAEFLVLALTNADYLGWNSDRGWGDDPAGVGIALSLAVSATWFMLSWAGVVTAPFLTSSPYVPARRPRSEVWKWMAALAGLLLLGLLAAFTRRRTGVLFLFLLSSSVLLPLAAALIKAKLGIRAQDVERFSELVEQQRRRRMIRRGIGACEKHRRHLVKELEHTRSEIERREKFEDLVSARKDVELRQAEVEYADALRHSKARCQPPRLTPVASIKARTYRRASRPPWRSLRILRERGRRDVGENGNGPREERERMGGEDGR